MEPEFSRLAREKGRLLTVESPKPIIMDDPNVVFVLEAGRADLYAAPVREGEVLARRRFVCALSEGSLIFPPPGRDSEMGWMIAAAYGTRLLQLPKGALRELGAHDAPALAGQVDLWLQGLLAAVTERVPPKDALGLLPHQHLRLHAGSAFHAEAGLVWVKPDQAEVRFLGDDALGMDSRFPFPLDDHVWAVAGQDMAVTTQDTESWVAGGADWAALDAFHGVVQALFAAQWHREQEDEGRLLKTKAADEQRILQKSVAELSSVVDLGKYRQEKILMEQEDALLTACRLVGDAMGVDFAPPPTVTHGEAPVDPLGDILRASGIRGREIMLSDEWWKQDNGPILAFLEDGNHPVALLPVAPHRYVLRDPRDPQPVPVNPGVAARLKGFGWTFYKPFPQRELGLKDILSFGYSSIAPRDLRNVMTLGLAGGILGLVTPVATGILFGSIIPETDRDQLFYMTLILVGTAVALFLFSVTQSVAMLRVETKMQTSVQAAVWDRLLSLPVPFFRRFSAGDLSHRALSIHAISQMISGAAMGTILSSAFSFFSLLLLFYYDVQLALLSVGMIAAALMVTVGFGYYQVRYQKQLMHIEGHTLSRVLQLVNGIAKFRVAGSEAKAFRLWSDLFKDLRQVEYRARLNEIFLSLFNTMLPVMTAVVLFMAVIGIAGIAISPGNFIAFSAAFNSFLGAMVAMSSVAITVLNLFPLYERAKPIFQTLPEVDEARQHPGELTGDIEVSHLCFRYDPEGPLILDTVSLHIRPGEFVALVGPSGSGKSTLFRCLLGFEQWESGMIYYDGKSLDSVDVQSVRRQTGVVLQNGKLMAADIFTNICGSSSVHTMDTAWEAAEGASLAEDIRQMPMGMHTFINEGATTISGGQRQRLLIARAIVNKPRILYFDEATSALDNKTQATVSRTLERLHATRVVIAHRLSTVRNADRIFVMDKGKIVQVGSYDELVSQEGLFADLAKRQLA